MHKYIYIILVYYFSLFFHLHADDQWEIYKMFQSYSQIEEFHGLLYLRNGDAIFYTDTETNTTGTITKLNGLSTSPIFSIVKSEESDKLVFVHQDGIIDIMNDDGEITNLYDFKDKTIVGDKTISHATICGRFLFLACGFGFIEVDLVNSIIANYCFTPNECSFAFKYAEEYYYALKGDGLWSCNGNKNLSVKSNWKQVDTKDLADVVVFYKNGTENCWILDKDKDIHILNPDGSYKKTSTRKCYEGLRVSGDYVFSPGLGVDMIRIDNQETSFIREYPFRDCTDFYAVSESVLYAVHPDKGLIKLNIEFNPWDLARISQAEESNDYFEVAGNQINELIYGHGVLAGTSGYKMYSRGYTDMYFSSANVNFYEDEQWHHLSYLDVMSQPLAGKEFKGLTNIAVDTNIDHRFYVSTLTTGIYQFDSNTLTKHLLDNERITAISCDQEGVLWAAKPYKDTTLWAYNADSDTWTPHNIAGHSNLKNIGRVFRQENEPHHLVWSLNNYSYRYSQIGILYNPTNAFDNSKDQSAYISTFKDQDENLYSLANSINYVYDMQEDNTGKIWLLTNIGPFVIEDVVKTFNHAQANQGIGLVKRVKVPRNDGTNLADYLLANTSCTAMVSDQYNRKWIGTLGNGIYLLSDDGMTELKHFTIENSPLHSNDITSLAYDEAGKRLFIACDGGVIIYHTDHAEPQDNFSSFYCYPNPIRPEYSGEIVIGGLMESTQVSITDTSGKLVWKSYSNNGSISWNGCDENGVRIKPGVYLVHGISKTASKGSIFKLLVL